MKKQLDFLTDEFKNSFDVKKREIETALGPATLMFVDTLCSTQFISEYIIKPLTIVKDGIETEDDVIKKVLNINSADFVKDDADATLHVLSGDVVIIFHDKEKSIYCEVKGYTRRSVSIPITEAGLKGPREGFTEAFVDNVTLIRRRVKNAALKFEAIYVGKESQTVVTLTYIEGIAPKHIVDSIRETLKTLDYNFILDSNYIEAKLRAKKTLFDTVGYTEKADDATAKILEGRVAVIVDGTPFVITVPSYFIENFQVPDDFYLNRYFATFTRTLRWVAFFIALFLPGIYVAITTHHFSVLPTTFILRLAVSRVGVPFPAIAEVLIIMFLFQLIKEAGLRLPQPIGTSMSLVASFVLGSSAVAAGIASTITIIVICISAVCYFLIPRLYGAVSLWSFIVAIFGALYGFPGIICIGLIILAHLSRLDTCGRPYLFPIGTLAEHRFKDLFSRGSLERISGHVIQQAHKRISEGAEDAEEGGNYANGQDTK